MDFIEKIFGISPDGGSGSLEMAFLSAPILLFAALVIVWRQNYPKF
jgi:hypothetical protein